MRNIKADNDILQSMYNSDVLMATEIKYIDSKSDGKSYSMSCRKAIYYCLEHHVPITSICPVIEVVLDQMAGLKIAALTEPCCNKIFIFLKSFNSDVHKVVVLSLDVDSDAMLNELQNSATMEHDKIVLYMYDILVQLLEGIIYVIKTQLHDYLEGTLAHLSPSIVHQASLAPVHTCSFGECAHNHCIVPLILHFIFPSRNPTLILDAFL